MSTCYYVIVNNTGDKNLVHLVTMHFVTLNLSVLILTVGEGLAEA